MSLSSKAVAKPTTILIIFIVLTALGLYSTSKLPIDLYPDLEIPYIIVSTSYPNAGPEEVENLVTKKIENATLGAENYFLPNRNLFYIFAHSMCMHARSMRMYAGEKRE